jgi:CrcB protein
MERVLWMSLGGACGTAARYLVTIAMAQRFGNALPWGTLAVNLTGCFAIAALVPAGAALGWSPMVRMAATVGFLGGFTTYSSFNYETMRLWNSDAPAAALLNMLLTIVGGFVAGWLGIVVGRQFGPSQ